VKSKLINGIQMAQHEKMMTTAELAEMLDLRSQSLRKMRQYGRGPKYVKIGNKVRYRNSDVEIWIKKNTRTLTGSEEPVST